MIAQASPALIVIFGITGDLSKRKLLPALINLTNDNLLHPETKIIGVTRQDIGVADILGKKPGKLGKIFSLMPMDLTSQRSYVDLKSHLDSIEVKSKVGYRRLYYLSIPPAVFDEVVGFMGKAGLQEIFSGGDRPALLVEKPFGYDLESAQELIKCTRRYFEETQVYRIDHYLAKEMAQNILDFRFGNPLFAGVWNGRHINKIVITAHEKIGIEGRVNFYEQTGALRDLIQSHLLQLMALVAMEKPRVMDSGHIHTQRLNLLESIMPTMPYNVAKETLRGQYNTYQTEVGTKSTVTETYAAVKLYIDNERWEGVPFVLRTGKQTGEKNTSVDIFFGNNVLTLRLQPSEGIAMNLNVKRPGHGRELAEAEMDFSYERSFSGHNLPDAYERVLLDAVRGDRTLFASSEEVLSAWRIVQPILDEWSKDSDDMIVYKNGQPPEVSQEA